jgi:hypothetical protein
MISLTLYGLGFRFITPSCLIKLSSPDRSMTFVCHPDLSRPAFHLQTDIGQPAAFCTASNPVTSGKPLIKENPAAARSSTCGQDWP